MSSPLNQLDVIGTMDDRLQGYFGRNSPIPDLEEESFNQTYNDIIGNLILCPDHRPEGIISVPLSSFLSLTIPEFVSSQHLINFVRDHLSQHLSRFFSETATNLRYIQVLFSSHLLTNRFTILHIIIGRS